MRNEGSPESEHPTKPDCGVVEHQTSVDTPPRKHHRPTTPPPMNSIYKHPRCPLLHSIPPTTGREHPPEPSSPSEKTEQSTIWSWCVVWVKKRLIAITNPKTKGSKFLLFCNIGCGDHFFKHFRQLPFIQFTTSTAFKPSTPQHPQHLPHTPHQFHTIPLGFHPPTHL